MILRHFRLLLVLCIGMLLGTGAYAQYYFFDTGTSTYPYQQGCSEDLYVRVNTESYSNGVTAGLLQLLFNPLAYSYDQSDTATTLQTNLFLGSTQTFTSWTSPTGTPSWIAWSNHTLLQIDRNNWATAYVGSNGLYGTIKFVPLYNASNGSFSIIYVPWDTTKTTLSDGGVNRITASQNSRLTGSYTFLQQPCVADINAPTLTISTPIAGTKKSSTSGIIFTLTDNGGVNGVTNVPYVFTGGGSWIANPAGAISNQYGINLSTLSLTISWNGNTQTYLGSSFSTGDSSQQLYAAPVSKTWQYLDLNYNAVITGSAIFNYGVEKTITITGTVKDRANNTYSLSTLTFNQPQGPTLISSSRYPDAGAIFVNLNVPVKLGIQDDWAGVNSWSIQVTLQGINGTTYWPTIFSWTQLNLSGVAGQANFPDQYINITNHADFPTSGTIQVSVYALDMAGNVDTIADYSFTTRPACSEFQCCNPISIQTGSNNPFTYVWSSLTISGGINPYFSWSVWTWGTGYLYCGTANNGLTLYSGHSNQSGSASLISFYDGTGLVFSGKNVVAYLTGQNNDTILLIKLGNFTIKVYPWSRPGGDYSNLWELRIFNLSKQFVLSWSLSSNAWWTWALLDNIPTGTYYIVYKGQSHLASYLSGIIITQGSDTTLDFTTWTNLYNVQNKSISTDDGWRYQIAWDMRNTIGIYDFTINGNDISSIVYGSGLVEWWIAVLDPKNLNGDTSVNGADIAIVGINFQLTDPFLTGAVTFNW